MRASSLSLLVVVAAVGCRARDAVDAGAPDAGGGAAVTGTSTSRMKYPGGHGSFVDVIQEASPAVVAIHATTPVKSGPASVFPGASAGPASDLALGTGFLIDYHGTYVLTNEHIASAAPELRVILHDGTQVTAAKIGVDPHLDLALLQVNAGRQATLSLGESGKLDVGEWVVVLGNPFGDEVTASVGVVSATGTRGLGSAIAGPASLFRTFLQTDARIHRGNTGGPVLDAAGRVVGIAVATDERVGEVSFAIPVDRVKDVLESLRQYGEVARAYLGAIVNAVPADLAQALPEAGGALITSVERNTPAARAGLRVGDIIVKWDGRPIDERTLPTLVASAVIDKKIDVQVFRSGALVMIGVVPERYPN